MWERMGGVVYRLSAHHRLRRVMRRSRTGMGPILVGSEPQEHREKDNPETSRGLVGRQPSTKPGLPGARDPSRETPAYLLLSQVLLHSTVVACSTPNAVPALLDRGRGGNQEPAERDLMTVRRVLSPLVYRRRLRHGCVRACVASSSNSLLDEAESQILYGGIGQRINTWQMPGWALRRACLWSAASRKAENFSRIVRMAR